MWPRSFRMRMVFIGRIKGKGIPGRGDEHQQRWEATGCGWRIIRMVRLEESHETEGAKQECCTEQCQGLSLTLKSTVFSRAGPRTAYRTRHCGCADEVERQTGVYWNSLTPAQRRGAVTDNWWGRADGRRCVLLTRKWPDALVWGQLMFQPCLELCDYTNHLTYLCLGLLNCEMRIIIMMTIHFTV